MTVQCSADKKYVTNITCTSKPTKNNFLFTLNATLNPSFIPVNNIFVNILIFCSVGRL